MKRILIVILLLFFVMSIQAKEIDGIHLSHDVRKKELEKLIVILNEFEESLLSLKDNLNYLEELENEKVIWFSSNVVVSWKFILSSENSVFNILSV